MKKIICIIALFFNLIILVGCYMPHYKDPSLGTYLSKKIESESSEFSSCRMEIQKITNAQYNLAEGINVCKPNRLISSYFRFEVYLFSTITNQEELVTLSDVHFHPNRFCGMAKLSINDKEYSSEFDIDYQNRPTHIEIFDHVIAFYMVRSDLYNGELIPLNKAYQAGLITYADLQQIAYHYNQKNTKDHIDYGEDFIPVPQPAAMDNLIAESTQYAWCKEPNSIPAKTEPNNFPDFYGYYHNYYAVSFYDSNNLLVDKHLIDDVQFYNYTEVYLWKALDDLVTGEILTLSKAYTNKWITSDDLKQISYLYNQRNSNKEFDYGDDFSPKEYFFPTLNEILCNSISEDFDKKFSPFGNYDVKPEHYGIFGNCYAVRIESSKDKEASSITTMDGIPFYNYKELYIWRTKA